MDENSGLMDDLIECECLSCKNVWWVPGYDEIELGMPTFCCFCGCEFNVWADCSEEGE